MNNEKGFLNIGGIICVFAVLIFLVIAYFIVSDRQKINNINKTLGSITTPEGFQQISHRCSGGGIDTRAYCQNNYKGNMTVEAAKQIKSQFRQLGFQDLGNNYLSSSFLNIHLKNKDMFISIAGGSNYIYVNAEAE